jgi:integrase
LVIEAKTVAKSRKSSREYDGIVLAKRQGKKGDHWLARVWLPDGAGGGKYRNRNFRTEKAAEGWAKDEKAKLRTGQETAGDGKLATLELLYLAYLDARGVSDLHQSQVKRTLARLKEWGATDLRDEAFGLKVLKGIKDHRACRPGQLKPTPAGDGYQRKLLIMAKGFCNWAVANRKVAYSPLDAIKMKKPNRTSKVTWNLEELKVLVSEDARWNLARNYHATVAAVNRHGGDKVAAAAELKVHPATIYNRLEAGKQGEDQLWLPAVLGLYLGTRPTETRTLTWEMMEWGTGDLVLPAETVGNKTRCERRIRMMDELRTILKPLAKVGSRTGPIVAPEIASMDKSVYSAAFARYCARVGVTEHGPHTLRHCCGSLMTAMGVQPVQVLLQLGHDSPIVSKHYAESAPKYRAAKDWGDQFRLRPGVVLDAKVVD